MNPFPGLTPTSQKTRLLFLGFGFWFRFGDDRHRIQIAGEFLRIQIRSFGGAGAIREKIGGGLLERFLILIVLRLQLSHLNLQRSDRALLLEQFDLHLLRQRLGVVRGEHRNRDEDRGKEYLLHGEKSPFGPGGHLQELSPDEQRTNPKGVSILAVFGRGSISYQRTNLGVTWVLVLGWREW